MTKEIKQGNPCYQNDLMRITKRHFGFLNVPVFRKKKKKKNFWLINYPFTSYCLLLGLQTQQMAISFLKKKKKKKKNPLCWTFGHQLETKTCTYNTDFPATPSPVFPLVRRILEKGISGQIH